MEQLVNKAGKGHRPGKCSTSFERPKHDRGASAIAYRIEIIYNCDGMDYRLPEVHEEFLDHLEKKRGLIQWTWR